MPVRNSSCEGGRTLMSWTRLRCASWDCTKGLGVELRAWPRACWNACVSSRGVGRRCEIEQRERGRHRAEGLDPQARSESDRARPGSKQLSRETTLTSSMQKKCPFIHQLAPCQHWNPAPARRDPADQRPELRVTPPSSSSDLPAESTSAGATANSVFSVVVAQTLVGQIGRAHV